MNCKRTILLIGFLWGAFSLTTYAQRINIGAGLGGFNYKGDLAPSFNPRNYLPGGHAFFRYNFSPSVSLRVGGNIGLVGAKDSRSSDPFNQARNQSFRNSITEGDLIMEYNFLNYKQTRKYKNWTPYLFGGLGFFKFKPQVKTAEYKTSQMNIPFGAGIKYEFKRPWSIEFEFGTRKLFTDYLDNLGNNVPIAQKTNLGNPTTKDMYYYTSITLSYTFYSIVCPPGFSPD
ncbi:MAG: DUF6089 family protein [Spirosomataceae bacterium]